MKDKVFVGRQNEVERLKNAFQQAVQLKQPEFVLIRGGFGDGKTTLTEKFLSTLETNDTKPIVSKAKLVVGSESSGLSAFSAILDSISNNQEIKRLIPNFLIMLGEVAPFWLDIFSLGAASMTVKAATKTIESAKAYFQRDTYEQRFVFNQYLILLRQLASKKPLVIFIDDLQWSDISSLSLLNYLASNLENVALLVICTYREDILTAQTATAMQFREIWVELIKLGAIDLELKKGIDVQEYLSARFPNLHFDQETITRLANHSRGHPFYLDELCTYWVETGAIIEQVNIAQPIQKEYVINTRILDLTMPDRVNIILEQRLNLLPQESKKILEAAAVEGENFTIPVVHCCSDMAEDEYYPALDKLEMSKFISIDTIGDEPEDMALDKGHFIHPFYREYIYQRIKHRHIYMKLHHKIGSCYEGLSLNGAEFAGSLCTHFYKCAEYVKCCEYALSATEFEQSRFSWAEAEKWCQLGLSAAQKIPQIPLRAKFQKELSLNLAKISVEIGEYKIALEHFQTVLGFLDNSELSDELIDVYYQMGDACEYAGYAREAKKYYEMGQQLLDKATSPFNESHFGYLTDSIYLSERQGNTLQAIPAYNQLLERAQTLPVTPLFNAQLGDFYNALGIAYHNLGDFISSKESFRKAAEISRLLHYPKLRSNALLNLADVCCATRHLSEAENYAYEALEFAKNVGDHDSIGYVHSVIGNIRLLEGDYFDAIKELTEAKIIYEELDVDLDLTYVFAYLSTIYLLLNDLDQAHQYAIDSVKHAEEMTYKYEIALSNIILARVLSYAGQWELAQDKFQSMITLTNSLGYKYIEGLAIKYFTEGCIQNGEGAKARKIAGAAISIFEKLKMDIEVAEINRLLDKH
jgi:tetratricopeptide (TPR) repeat protein